MNRCQQEHLVHKDRRLQKIVEILNHLKIIKFHVWENTFEESVKDLRAEELESLKEFLLLQAFQVRLFSQPRKKALPRLPHSQRGNQAA